MMARLPVTARLYRSRHKTLSAGRFDKASRAACRREQCIIQSRAGQIEVTEATHIEAAEP